MAARIYSVPRDSAADPPHSGATEIDCRPSHDEGDTVSFGRNVLSLALFLGSGYLLTLEQVLK